MFTIKEYLSMPYKPELYTITVRNEEFLVRRMNGVESIKVETVQGDQRVLFVLSDCVYDGATKRPLGPINAEEFLKQYGGLAVEVFSRIVNDTNDYELAEREKVEAEVKNSEATVELSNTGNTASDSGSTLSAPTSQTSS